MSVLDPLRAVFRQKGLGHLKDLPDARDQLLGSERLASDPTAALPSAASLRHPSVRAKSQGGTQSCSGQALVQAYRESALAHGLDCPDLSALANYNWGRAVWGGQRTDEGSYLRTAIKAAARLGIPTEEKWPFTALRVNTPPNMPAVFDAAARRLKLSYYRIASGDLYGVRRALASKCAVVAGFMVDQYFLADQGEFTIDAQDPHKLVGGHALVIDGYLPDFTFEILNSWGSAWRNSGRAYVTEGFLNQATDCWAILVQ